MNERLTEIVNRGLAYYVKDPRHEFNGKSQLTVKYTREQRLAFIGVLINEIKKIPIMIVKNEGFGTVQIDVDNMSQEQRNLIKYITLDLNASTLRGTITGYKLKSKDFPFINKWNPLVMYILAKKHALVMEDFIVCSNNGKHFLGKDLMDLLVTINESEAININVYSKYYISFLHRIIKEEKLTPDDHNPEDVTDSDENRIIYSNKGNQIIRIHSPWSHAYTEEYTKAYDLIAKENKLTKEFMETLVKQGIKNKMPTPVIPEGEEF